MNSIIAVHIKANLLRPLLRFMKAAVLYKPAKMEENPLKIEQLEIPKIEDDEVLIRIKACGVCRSNLHMIEGDWLDLGVPAKLPIIPGHEIVGIVEKVGKEVRNVKVGDRVGVQPLYSTCGACEYCISGRENLCNMAEITGETVDGGYAEYMKAKAAHVYEVPSNLKDEEAAPLFCPGVTAYRAVMLSEISPAKSVAIFGIGGVGHLAIQFAKLYGAKVIAVSADEQKLRIAKELGADLTISSKSDVVNQIISLGYVDSSIVFAPSDEAVFQATQVTKKGGIIVIGVRANLNDFRFANEQIIKGSVIGTRVDMMNVLKIASQGKLKVYYEVYQLEEINSVLKKLKRREIRER